VTKKDILNLNRNLIKASDDIINYIIIHELCHLKIPGHSHTFWSFLKQFVPDYQKKIDWLNRNSESLMS
jgi:predicted metal-dependent hydrolase